MIGLLLWNVQKFVAVLNPRIKSLQLEFSIKHDLPAKNPQWNKPCEMNPMPCLTYTMSVLVCVSWMRQRDVSSMFWTWYVHI